MNRTVKIVAYVALGLALFGSGWGMFQSLNRSSTRSPASSTNAPSAPETPTAAVQDSGHWIKYFAGLLAAGVLLAVLAAYDLSHFFAHRVHKFIFNEDLQGVHDPEYEEAEKVWANGRHLEAIQLMRDYLKKHPMEQYVALRIAEIYEKDLGNHLAAVLEYEEILKKKLPPDRWGWAAIHLANLYSGKLNKSDQAMALLRRIVDEYGDTPAAKKARERLGLPEQPMAQFLPQPPFEEPNVKASNLPPGFRPK